jgi:hypothetical protein
MRWFAAGLLLLAVPAWADTLEVGPDGKYKSPSEALQAATDGDVIEIAEGEYYDCGRVVADHVTIVGMGEGATLSDTTCDGKAILVVRGDDTTIRNMTFTRARVPDGNGAGIRAEGRDLTVEKSKFVNNQTAILASSSPHSVITIKNSSFEDNGGCDERGKCAHTLNIGDIAKLRVEKSTLTGARGGFLIATYARRTELVSNTIGDGPKGHSDGLVQASIGALVAEDNIFEKASPYTNRRAAVFVLASGAPLGDLYFRHNTYNDTLQRGTAFVINYSGADVATADNSLPAGIEEVSSDGIWRARAGALYRGTRDGVLDSLRLVRGGVRILLGGR